MSYGTESYVDPTTPNNINGSSPDAFISHNIPVWLVKSLWITMKSHEIPWIYGSSQVITSRSSSRIGLGAKVHPTWRGCSEPWEQKGVPMGWGSGSGLVLDDMVIWLVVTGTWILVFHIYIYWGWLINEHLLFFHVSIYWNNPNWRTHILQRGRYTKPPSSDIIWANHPKMTGNPAW